MGRGRSSLRQRHSEVRTPAAARIEGVARRAVRDPLRSTPRSASRGQVLALLLPLLAALIAVLWWVLEAGEAALEKQRLRNTADAAVLAGAVWQAKVQNFDAYTNRAIVANEAFIAQAVSLRGWSAYLDDLLPKASLVTAPVPYLGPVMTALQRAWDAIDRALQPTLLATEGITSLLNHDLAAAQRLMHASVPVAVPQLVQAVVSANDSRYEITTGGESLLLDSAAEWSQYASFYGGSFRWRQRDVIQRSMDGFSHERNWSLGLPMLRLQKRAGTELIDFDTWRALDTLAIHQPRYFFFGRMRETTPVAWAAVENGVRTPLRGIHGGAYSVNPRTARLAERFLQRGRGYLGLPSMWDLSSAQRAAFDPPVVSVRIALADERRRSARTLWNFDRLGDLSGDDHTLSSSAAGARMFAEAAATTSFHRPVPRIDGAHELPSLYNPYWRPRLTALPLRQRLQVAALDGDPLWLAGVPR